MMEIEIRGKGVKRVSTQSDPITGNTQVLVVFDNGWELSVIRGPETYGSYNGLVEVMVFPPKDWRGTTPPEIVPIVRDSLGWQTLNDVYRWVAIVGGLE